MVEHRRAVRMAYWNGALWAIGNGLASSPLVLYLVMEYQVSGLGVGIGLVLAAPHLVGLLRLAVPLVMDRCGGRKPFCVATCLLSGLALVGLPAAAAGGRLSTGQSLAALLALWCACQLLEYLSMIALWSWLADLVPRPVRGRFIGRRECWMAVGQAAAMLASGLFMWGWARIHPDAPRWVGYAVTIVLGGGFVLAAAVPLALMPAARERRHLDNSPRHPPGRPQRPPASLAAPAVPLVRGRFLRLLVIGCWISITNGLLQSPQTIFPNRVLGLSVLAMLALKVGLRLGQWPISPRLGKLTDRWGNRPVMALSLLVVAQGPAFYFLATPRQPWWIVGAWACWIAWAGLNIALPNLMLTLSPARSNTPYIATYFAVTGLCHGLSTILGGSLFDRYGGAACLCPAIPLDYYHAAFLLGWITWSLGAVLVLAVVREPPAGEGEGTGLGR